MNNEHAPWYGILQIALYKFVLIYYLRLAYKLKEITVFLGLLAYLYLILFFRRFEYFCGRIFRQGLNKFLKNKT